jgi:hypothetical protein
MHYFLGLEWQRSDEKENILLRSCKDSGRWTTSPWATPMTINLKLLSDSSSDLVDPTMYRKLIRSLMYLVNTRLGICLAVKALSQVYG